LQRRPTEKFRQQKSRPEGRPFCSPAKAPNYFLAASAGAAGAAGAAAAGAAAGAAGAAAAGAAAGAASAGAAAGAAAGFGASTLAAGAGFASSLLQAETPTANKAARRIEDFILSIPLGKQDF
jgi:hypothetical protein